MKHKRSRVTWKCIVLASLPFVLIGANTHSWAGATQGDAETLTQQLVHRVAAHANSSGVRRDQSLQALSDIVAQRQALLAELIESDPGSVLRYAIPNRIRNQMPLELRAVIEHYAGLKGQLEVLYEDLDNGSHRLRHTLVVDDHRIVLHFDSDPPRLRNGLPVFVRGILLERPGMGPDDAMALESANDVLPLASGQGVVVDGNDFKAIADSTSHGEQKTAVILVNFPSKLSEPWTPTQARNVVFDSVDAFLQENAQGQVWLSGDVYGWFTLQMDPSGCPATDIAFQAKQAARASGADLSGYDRFIYGFPDIGCSWSGLGTVGDQPSQAWFDGALGSAGAVSHELGHNFGLHHSHAQACAGEAPLSASCIAVEYGDVLDRMGRSDAGHFNAFQKERLGWLDNGSSPTIVTANTSGVYALEAYAELSAGVKALRIPRDVDPVTGLTRWYYLENRQPIGYDGYIATSRYASSVMNGIVFRVGTWEDPGSSFLLDMTPGSQYYDWDDLALGVGQTYSDPVAGVTITVDAVDSTSATVHVDLGVPSCTRTDPIVTMTPSTSAWELPGTAVEYTATITNGDSAACSGAVFSLTALAPGGWTTELGAASFALPPGGSASTPLTVTSLSSANEGTYDIAVSATHQADPAYVGSATVIYKVLADTSGQNSPPVAENDSATLTQTQPIVIFVLENDWDPDDDTIHVTQASQGMKGTVKLNGDGTLTYTPGRHFKNKDTFSYAISDGMDSSTAQVTVVLQASSGGGGKGSGGKGGGGN